MNKTATPGNDNSVTRLPIPLFGDINNRRFLTAVLSGVLGGAGVSAAANLLRSYREMRSNETKDTDDETIVLRLPKAASADGYTSMRDAKPGESKVTTNGSRQFRESGRYGKTTGSKSVEKDAVKCADGNPGPNSVGTVVANAIGLTSGGLLAYDVVSRLFDAMNERRLKRKLEAAQQAYVNAMTGASKRAETVMSVIRPVERVIMKEAMDKEATGIGWLDWTADKLPDAATNAVRYPTAAYILALLAGTGATAYVTKKIMDREFPEEKIKKDINKPTRIVFKTAEGKPVIMESDGTQEKEASAETCAAIAAMLPIYMDVVEGRPNRTLAEPYVKMAQAAGTDAEGLMKMAVADVDLSGMYKTVLSDPMAVWEILKATGYGFDFSKEKAVNALRQFRPDTYKRAVGASIDAKYKVNPNDGFWKRNWDLAKRTFAHTVANNGGRDWMVNKAVKSAGISDIVNTDMVLKSLGTEQEEDGGTVDEIDAKAVLRAVRNRMKGRRRVSIEAGDPEAYRYLRSNKAKVRKVLSRLNAQGAI